MICDMGYGGYKSPYDRVHQSDSSGATTGPRRHPTTMGFNQLLDLECTPPTAGPRESKDEALSQQVIEGAFLFLAEAAKDAQLSRHKDTLSMTDRIIHKNWETPKTQPQRTNCTIIKKS